QIILVENLTVMANLPRLNIPTNLKDALWLYRGDSQKFQHTATASKFYKRFQNTHQLICFSDFDPAGLQIALTCSATQWLTLQSIDDLNTELLGYEHEWFKQTNAIKYINDKAYLPDPIQLLFSAMNHHQKTLKQEHMLAHELPLVCYELL
ncbi:MAG: hypothetical protein GY951_03530, partial [Psychromonas sp.]|nr:hypothetical protein [Psychromonas sp.]